MWTINRFVIQDCEWFVGCDYEVIGYDKMLMIPLGIDLNGFWLFSVDESIKI
jgi:hypothetical protein